MNGKKWICLAAALGAGYASGSEIALFYAQLGRGAHIAALIAAAIYVGFGLLCVRLKRDTGADNLPLALRRRMGAGAGQAAALLHLAAMSIAALRSVNMAGRIAEILLPAQQAYIVGAGICVLLAAALARDRGAAGAIWIFACMLGALFLMLGGREVKSGLAHVQLLIEDSISAAVLSGTLHGSMLCAVTGSAMLDAANDEKSAICAGGALFCMLEIAYLCMKSAGKNVLSLRQPFIAMAAAWGSAGQIAVSILMISGAALTLRVCVRGTIRIVRERREL